MLKQFMKNCIPWEGPHAGVVEECKEEGAAEVSWLQPPFPCPHLLLKGVEVEDLGMKEQS